jgi:hypothetical protein
LYCPMEVPPFLPQITAFGTPFTLITDLGRFIGGSRGLNAFTTAGGLGTSHQMAFDQQEGEGNTMDLNITQPPSPTPYAAPPNPNPNGTGSAPQPSETPHPNGSRTDTQATLIVSPLGNQVIHRVIRLTSSVHTRSTGTHPGAIMDARTSDYTARRVWFHD